MGLPMIQKLPIFPLNTVLFPGARLQLHIFEERYRLMIGRCLEQHTPFGVVLIRKGGEISPDDPWVRRQIEEAGGGDAELSMLRRQLGGEAVPYAVGTTAQISTRESVRLDDGRYYLVAFGQRRFRIQYLVQRQPYLIASVAYLAEESAPTSVELASQLRILYARYWDAVSAATGVEKPSDHLPESVAELSYWMAHRFQVSNAQKQRWLEADLMTRLHAITAALRAELAMFRGSEPGEREHGQSRPGSWN
jgi:Lon protease-like protein